jgi:hypothetical protein
MRERSRRESSSESSHPPIDNRTLSASAELRHWQQALLNTQGYVNGTRFPRNLRLPSPLVAVREYAQTVLGHPWLLAIVFCVLVELLWC